jgi:hypothetical protein
MKVDTSRALFSKHNKILCNSILSDLDNWLKAKFLDANNNIAFRKSVSIRVHTSTINQRKSQTQVKYNAYESRTSKRFCSENPNEAVDSVDTAPNHTPKRCINITYADAAANSSCMQEPAIADDKADTPITAPQLTQDTTSVISSVNSSRLTELESSIQSIDSERLSFQSKFKGLQAEFPKVITSALQHSKQIQAIQSDMRGLSDMVLGRTPQWTPPQRSSTPSTPSPFHILIHAYNILPFIPYVSPSQL